MGFNEYLQLYKQYGNRDYLIGETITQTQHVLQAAHIAKICGAPDYIIIGLLVHDIGQLLGISLNENIAIKELHAKHDDIGSEWLNKEGFSKIICNITQYHTLAKVLLCEEDPNYLKTLSLASRNSYFIQRDKYLNISGCRPAKSNSGFELPGASVRLLGNTNFDFDKNILLTCRLIDDMAKIPNFTPGCLEDYEFLYNNMIGNHTMDDNKLWIKTVKDLFLLQQSNYEEFLQRIQC